MRPKRTRIRFVWLIIFTRFVHNLIYFGDGFESAHAGWLAPLAEASRLAVAQHLSSFVCSPERMRPVIARTGGGMDVAILAPGSATSKLYAYGHERGPRSKFGMIGRRGVARAPEVDDVRTYSFGLQPQGDRFSIQVPPPPPAIVQRARKPVPQWAARIRTRGNPLPSDRSVHVHGHGRRRRRRGSQRTCCVDGYCRVLLPRATAVYISA